MQAAELRPARLEEGEALSGTNTTVAAGCIELPGLAPLGQMLLAAAANLQPDFEACWLSCLAVAGCNALAFWDPAFQARALSLRAGAGGGRPGLLPLAYACPPLDCWVSYAAGRHALLATLAKLCSLPRRRPNRMCRRGNTRRQ
jgi:hypothetical protein